MDLGDYVRVVWRWLWLILLGTAVAAGTTYVVVRDDPPEYQAKATVMVGKVLSQQQPQATDIWTAESLTETYREIAQRRAVREAAQKALGWGWLPAYTVSRVPNAQLLEIVVVASDPVSATLAANALAEELKKQSPSASGPDQEKRRLFVRAQLDDLEVSIGATKDEITRLEKALAGMFSAREISDTQAQIVALQQKLNGYQANYGQLLQYMGDEALNQITIVEPAVEPTAPVGPNKARMVLMAAAVGLMLSLLTAFLLEYLDDTIKSSDDVTAAMGLTTLAGISRIQGATPREKLITVRHPRSPISEAYRSLRTNLQFSSLDRPLRSLVVTSPNPVEGKTTTAANLAVVMAQAGNRVILVDADLRRPVLHRAFEVENERGLTGLLLQSEPDLDGHLQATGVENLRLLSSGPLPPNPSELLGSKRMAALLERLEQVADLVIFDSPPALAVTDASVLGTQVDGVLLVTDSGRTRRGLAREVTQRLRQVGANLVGVVLNRLKSGGRGYYYYYYQSDKGNGSRRKRKSRGKRRPA